MENSRVVQEFLQSADVKRYNPHTYLIESSNKTKIQNIFQNPNCPVTFVQGRKLLIDIFGPSGVGKDTITRIPGVADVRIATSRAQRTGEADTAYEWMERQNDGETQEDYYRRLIEQYDLVSYAIENGILYGVPRSGLEAIRDSNVTTVRMSARSIDMLRKNLGDEYNIVSLMVVPDNFESLIPSIIQRGNVDKRLGEVIENMKLGKLYANYFLLNKHASDSEDVQKQIDAGKKSFEDFVKTFIAGERL